MLCVIVNLRFSILKVYIRKECYKINDLKIFKFLLKMKLWNIKLNYIIFLDIINRKYE